MTWREVTATLILLAQESGLPISVECWNYRTAVRRQGAGLWISLPLFRLIAKLLEMGFEESDPAPRPLNAR